MKLSGAGLKIIHLTKKEKQEISTRKISVGNFKIEPEISELAPDINRKIPYRKFQVTRKFLSKVKIWLRKDQFRPWYQPEISLSEISGCPEISGQSEISDRLIGNFRFKWL